VYIPVSPLLLEMLQWSELRKTPTGTAAAPDMLMLLRLNKTQLKTSALQEEVVSQVRLGLLCRGVCGKKVWLVGGYYCRTREYWMSQAMQFVHWPASSSSNVCCQAGRTL
jgi:ABC-type cobalamin transport system permease subunit